MKILILLLIFKRVISHGFMMGLIDCNTKKLLGKVRGYSDITLDIDSLRNPTTVECRGISEAESITLKSTDTLCVALAISNGAAHKGSCNLKYINKLNGVKVISQIKEKCLNPEDISVNNIPGLTTGDMTRYDTFFKIPCFNYTLGSFIIKFEWEAQHITPFEHYNNCIDVLLV